MYFICFPTVFAIAVQYLLIEKHDQTFVLGYD